MEYKQKTYTAEEIRKIALSYRGKPENFSAEFAKEKRSTRMSQAKNFADNYSKAPILVQEVYQAYQPDVKQLDRILAPAEMSYYTTALLWLRLIDIKAKQGRIALSSAEKDLHKVTMEDKFNVPQPIYAYLSQIGEVKDKGGKTTELEIPALPIATVGGCGGYHAASVTAQSHNLFEEVPCLGIAADVMALQTQQADTLRSLNFHIGKPANTVFTRNLCSAQMTPAFVRPDIISKLDGQGISNDSLAEFVRDTRFNLRYLRHYWRF
ncbi:hypothetical protein J437_LFUL019487 [Ladona fulva]|nr:hypothetical protein J437_LFUL019487 [Ladona fulva]